MSLKSADVIEIPAALPISEEADERERLLREAAGLVQSGDDAPAQPEDEDYEELSVPPKASRKKLFLVFVLTALGFVVLLLLMSWFFRLGSFAPDKAQAVDRTAKTNSVTTAPVPEEEKLKMALNMVAGKEPEGGNGEQNEAHAADPGSSVDLPPAGAGSVDEPVVVPESAGEKNRSTNNSSSRSANSEPGDSLVVSSSARTPSTSEEPGTVAVHSNGTGNYSSSGRSLFFGIERREVSAANPARQTSLRNTSDQSPFEVERPGLKHAARPPVPFGTLLPVRFLGAVYTFQGSGGLVRLELTRNVSGKDYSYPAGTVLVGTVRGGEYDRAFISITGLIDPATGGLIKFAGEVMGSDGGSGVPGRRRQVKSAWKRVLEALRETGAAALGALGNSRSGPAVVISDSTSKVSGELAGLAGSARNSSEFIEIFAGTNAFVLITDLPAEVPHPAAIEQNSNGAPGPSDTELADLLSDGDKAKIRAALPRMTPRFRALAERYLETVQKIGKRANDSA